ncbi:uncharacterized protein B0T15DRAFT_19161 [Chaetomium strumarium]|uniref:Uncharacterized protein n=1 Tax=Chaetomium strumarium TaxID=1170767 RepID=A0AAJ0M5S7_9PEZI|nr:hypothetical protein B0T15DRAFT_19161 [Chaetomium strumarium]
MSFQTPGGPAAKRRRIETANATLRKPFRSPMISRQQNQFGTGSTLESPSTSRAGPAAVSTPQTPATPASLRSQRPAPPATASPLSTAPNLTAGDTPEPRRSTNLDLGSGRSIKATGCGAASPGEHEASGADLLHRILASQRRDAGDRRGGGGERGN